MTAYFFWFAVGLCSCLGLAASARAGTVATQIPPRPVTLSETVAPLPFVDVRNGHVTIAGRDRPARMTFVWHLGGKLQFYYYQTGHWIHALADMYALTGDRRYRDRAEAMVSYLCGDNPFQARLFNELGGVYNWTDDTDGDGIEDLLKQDMYPESSAFCQIGIMRLLRSIAEVEGTARR